MTDVIADAKEAFENWKDAPTGSYIERVLAQCIVRDIVPSLLHLAENGKPKTGFVGEEEVEK